ncbi:hypothetical protein TrST_g7561 [Triparma strigata]|nr:hypothetical protein TrST_g7561 [Triparma strigata]
MVRSLEEKERGWIDERHSTRNILSSLRVLSKLARRKVDSGSENDVKELLGTIDERIGAIDFGGRVLEGKEVFFPEDKGREVVKGLKPMAEEKEKRISLISESRALTFSPYAPVLEELITNAIKYGTGNDILVKIEQRDEMVVTTVESEGDECGTEIWGRGVGTGTGIGLDYVRRCVENVGGKVWLEREGGWNKFGFEIEGKGR